MSEYIYAIDGQQGHWFTGEEIVRCRDCCYYQPCTVAQGVRCCAACMMCSNPCKKAGNEKHDRVRR